MLNAMDSKALTARSPRKPVWERETQWYRFVFDDGSVMTLEFRSKEHAKAHADSLKARVYAL